MIKECCLSCTKSYIVDIETQKRFKSSIACGDKEVVVSEPFEYCCNNYELNKAFLKDFGDFGIDDKYTAAIRKIESTRGLVYKSNEVEGLSFKVVSNAFLLKYDD